MSGCTERWERVERLGVVIGKASHMQRLKESAYGLIRSEDFVR